MSPGLRRAAHGLAGAALLIAVVTVVARAVGFLRVVVLARTVGTSCLGDAYATANAVPNVVFEVVVGGALAASVVPLLALGATDRDHADVRARVAALYGWTLALLIPVTALAYLLADPIVGLLLGPSDACAGDTMRATTRAMLYVFLLQIPLYGVTVVAQGALQAHRRFLAPALAPLVSSLVVIGAYLTYAAVSSDQPGSQGSLVDLTWVGFAALAGGTTLGVAALLATQLPTLARQGLVVRPTWRFPAGVAARARTLAVSGLVIVGSQWLAFAVAIRLANGQGPEGSVIVLTVAWTVFLLPWAVLVYPISTSVFPHLSAQADRGDSEGFARVSATSARAALVAAALGAVGLAAVAWPAAVLIVAGVPGRSSVAALAWALTAFTPAVVAFGLHGHLLRILTARGAAPLAAAVSGAGYALAGGTAAAAVAWVARDGRSDAVVAAIGVGFSTGLVGMVLGLLVAVRRRCGAAALAGLGRTAVAAAIGAVLAVPAGRLVAGTGDTLTSPGSAVVAAVLAGGAVVVVFGGVVGLVDRASLRTVAARLASRGRPSP